MLFYFMSHAAGSGDMLWYSQATGSATTNSSICGSAILRLSRLHMYADILTNGPGMLR